MADNSTVKTIALVMFILVLSFLLAAKLQNYILKYYFHLINLKNKKVGSPFSDYQQNIDL